MAEDQAREEQATGGQAARMPGAGPGQRANKQPQGKHNKHQACQIIPLGGLTQKSVIIHKDENGFGLRIKGQWPVCIEHVHEHGAAWRAGVRTGDHLCKVNGVPVSKLDHKEVVLLFRSCSRFVALTLVSPLGEPADSSTTTTTSAMGATTSPSSEPMADFLGARARCPDSLAAHLASRRMSGVTASTFAPAPLMDRTNSCRSAVGAARLLSGASPKFGLNLSQALTQTKLCRQDSLEAKAADKRLAICICCRTSIESEPAQAEAQQANPAQQQQQQQVNSTITICSQCQLRCQRASQLDQIHRQLHSASLRDAGRAGGDGGGCGSARQTTEKPATATATATKLLSSASMKSLPGGQTAKPAQVNRRIEIIREFIDTERTHTERLRCLDELFYRPLREAGLVNSEQLRMVFSSHRTLYKIHKQIYRILMSANYDVYSEPLVGSALLEIFEGDLKKRLERASCSFCSAQATNTELLNKLTRRDTKSGELLAQITSQRMVGRLGIKDLLASCFQRLTKYPLLLENLLKATPQSLGSQDDEDEPELELGGPHRRRSKSGLSVHQRRARMRAGLSHGADELNESSELEDCAETNATAAAADDDDDDEDREAEGQDEEEEVEEEDEDARLERVDAAEEARRNSRRIMAISLAEEREFIERALAQSRAILVRVNESIRVAIARQRLKEIWKRTDKYPGVPLPNIAKQQVVHEGLLTLRLSKRSFDVYVLLLNDYIIILTREGQDKYRLKFFTPEGKSSASSLVSSSQSTSVSSFMSGVSSTGGGGGANGGTNGAANPTGTNGASGAGTNTANMLTPLQTVYSPVFLIDEHLTTRDAATDENGFYLLCKRKDDSRIYEFASRSPAERMKWRDKIQWTIERQMGRSHRRPSCESALTKSSSEISANSAAISCHSSQNTNDSKSGGLVSSPVKSHRPMKDPDEMTQPRSRPPGNRPATPGSAELTKIVGTISYVIDDGIVMPNKMESSRVFVDQAIQVNILDGSIAATRADQETPSVVGLAPEAR